MLAHFAPENDRHNRNAQWYNLTKTTFKRSIDPDFHFQFGLNQVTRSGLSFQLARAIYSFIADRMKFLKK